MGCLQMDGYTKAEDWDEVTVSESEDSKLGLEASYDLPTISSAIVIAATGIVAFLIVAAYVIEGWFRKRDGTPFDWNDWLHPEAG